MRRLEEIWELLVFHIAAKKPIGNSKICQFLEPINGVSGCRTVILTAEISKRWGELRVGYDIIGMITEREVIASAILGANSPRVLRPYSA